MKTFSYLLIFIFISVFLNCTKKNLEGEVISVPATISFNDLSKGVINDVEFRGDVVKVKLENGDVVDAIATKKQMEQVLYDSMSKATLEKDDNDNWKVIKLEKPKE
ncbi:MAG: hypothetical protein RDU14_03380 [Melioribacteraceae bacterium]|nr:hypothetical protein [Melioribacteraceae bacterium]